MPALLGRRNIRALDRILRGRVCRGRRDGEFDAGGARVRRGARNITSRADRASTVGERGDGHGGRPRRHGRVRGEPCGAHGRLRGGDSLPGAPLHGHTGIAVRCGRVAAAIGPSGPLPGRVRSRSGPRSGGLRR